MKRLEAADTRPQLPAELIAGPDILRWASPELAARLRAGDGQRRGNGHLPIEASVSAWRNYQAARRDFAAEHGMTAREFIDRVHRERSTDPGSSLAISLTVLPRAVTASVIP